MNICDTCKKPENFPEDSKSELRPYGPGGSLICFRCAFETPEAIQRTRDIFRLHVDMNDAAGIPTIIGKLPE